MCHAQLAHVIALLEAHLLRGTTINTADVAVTRDYLQRAVYGPWEQRGC